jgi:glycosyltransferase involved in cell wall biosynthesis
MSNIIINALGISDSGGITVLNNLLNECIADNSNKYYVIYNKNNHTDKLVNKFSVFTNLNFEVVISRGFLYRFCYENIFLGKIVNHTQASLVYNFSGSNQFFLKIPQITKVQNLIFYSKKLDAAYRKDSQLILWARQVYLKRLFFKFMLSKSKYIEIQSNHVKSCLLDFIDTREKSFYVKSDIDVSDGAFYAPKQYDFSKKIKFLYIVGPHFEYLHKNLLDFTNAMLELNKNRVDFEINITLTNEQLSNSKVWNVSLNSKTNFLGYISDQEKMKELFCDNTILISTSVIETLGLHVIEGIKNGVITIAPDEEYANAVYGENMFKYKLFNKDSLLGVIMNVMNYKGSYSKKILSLQDDLRQSEACKFGSILDVFNEVKSVQK